MSCVAGAAQEYKLTQWVGLKYLNWIFFSQACTLYTYTSINSSVSWLPLWLCKQILVAFCFSVPRGSCI